MIKLSTGNLKMKNVLIWNLPAQVTCVNSTELCRSKCYAKKAERLYPQVLPFRQSNLHSSKYYTFVHDMIETIKLMNSKRKKYKYFRIHESGDFYSEAYFIAWLEVIKVFPDIKFLAFTKSVFVRNHINRLPANLNLFYSVWNDSKPENIIYELPLALAGDCGNLYHKEVKECAGKCSDETCGMHCFNKKEDIHFSIH